MNRKLIKYVIFTLILLLFSAASFFTWQKYHQKSTVNSSTKTETSNTEKVYPKIEKFEVPILMYHYIRDASSESQLGKNLSVSPQNFDYQVKWMVNDGYVSISMSDLADQNKKEISKIYAKNKKPIVLTFDDGYEDAYTQAYQILKKYKFTGTFFIIRDYVGRPEYMTETQINEMSKAGMEIGSHSLTHPNLESLSKANQQKQIFDSKKKATSFCYPAGKYNNITVTLVKEAGYLTAVTTKSGVANQDSNIFELPRVRVENISANALAEKIKSLENK